MQQACSDQSLRSPEADLSVDTALAAIQARSGDPESQRLVRELGRLVNHIKAALGVVPAAGFATSASTTAQHGPRSP